MISDIKYAFYFNTIFSLILIAIVGGVYCAIVTSYFGNIFGIIGTIFLMGYVTHNANIIKKAIKND